MPVRVQSSVVFNTTERANRVVLWIQQSFNVDEKMVCALALRCFVLLSVCCYLSSRQLI
jgi:hypothetical protein